MLNHEVDKLIGFTWPIPILGQFPSNPIVYWPTTLVTRTLQSGLSTGVTTETIFQTNPLVTVEPEIPTKTLSEISFSGTADPGFVISPVPSSNIPGATVSFPLEGQNPIITPSETSFLASISAGQTLLETNSQTRTSISTATASAAADSSKNKDTGLSPFSIAGIMIIMVLLIASTVIYGYLQWKKRSSAIDEESVHASAMDDENNEDGVDSPYTGAAADPLTTGESRTGLSVYFAGLLTWAKRHIPLGFARSSSTRNDESAQRSFDSGRSLKSSLGQKAKGSTSPSNLSDGEIDLGTNRMPLTAEENLPEVHSEPVLSQPSPSIHSGTQVTRDLAPGQRHWPGLGKSSSR
ncbi:hypothetical protein BS50DRAFT_631284 [Corynespora cassiicola Philippines]|uniref:Uncharacterized protein n=1 Tax=Corynespora cassiicola Philippines TaxID=1448308 RepID=A0A2T2P0U7_CORCC|nr:hypothetical protein BS50DRAFT_631284 [Corynespora cassiicola Philippines]